MIEDTRPVNAPGAFLEYNIVRVAAQLEIRFRSALKPAGFTPHQFSALAIIQAHPNRNPAELARLVLLTPQSMGAIIQQLEESGLLKRHGMRARGVPTQIVLTAKGRRALNSAWRIVSQLDAETRKCLGRDYLTAQSIMGRLNEFLAAR